MSGDDDRGEQQPMTDEEALTALFASLVQDSPASEVSPDRVIELARSEHDAALDRKIKRLKLGRNLLLAAVLAGFVAIVVPKLGHSSSEQAATSASSSAAAPIAPPFAASAASSAAASAGSAPAAAAASAPGSGSAAAGGSAASGGGAASGGSAPAGTSARAAESAAAAPGSVAAGSAAAGADAATTSTPASGAASSAAGGGLPAPTAATARGCSLLPIKSVVAVRAQFPAGQFGPAIPLPKCTGLYGVTLEPRAPNRQPLHIDVTLAAAGSCRNTVPACVPLAGAPGAYRQPTAGLGSPVYVYGNGYQVRLFVDATLGTSVTAADLAKAGDAVITSLG